MSHLTHRFTSFLDRFESRLEVDCERLKRQLLARVDHQFGVVRAKVTELRGRFGGDRADGNLVPSLHIDDPKVKTVSLDEWILDRRAVDESHNAPSTSGLKRKSVSHSQSTNKRQKTQMSTAVGTNKHVCKYPGCGKTFPFDGLLANHERIHLGVKPFRCTWPNCQFSSETRSHVIRHVREKHFMLSRKKKGEPPITDDRDPNQFVQVDNDLVERRIE